MGSIHKHKLSIGATLVKDKERNLKIIKQVHRKKDEQAEEKKHRKVSQDIPKTIPNVL